MSYGILVKNGVGGTLINTEDPILQYHSKATLSASLVYTPTLDIAIFEETGTSYYLGNANFYAVTISAPPVGDFLLIECPSGGRVHMAPRGPNLNLVSTQSTIRIATFRISRNLPSRTSGYGVVVFDSLGRQVWTEDTPMLDITGTAQNPGAGSWFFVERESAQLGYGEGWRGFRNSGSGLVPEIMMNPSPSTGRSDMLNPFRGFVANIDYDNL